MWDGRREAGQWSARSQPAALIARECLWLLTGLLVVWNAYDGAARWVLMAALVAVAAMVLRRDLRNRDQPS